MRRIILFLILLVLIGTGIWWFFLRLTPEKALHSALVNLSKAQTIQAVRGQVYWVFHDPKGGSVLGKDVSFTGSVDLRDISRVQAEGVVEVSETGSERDLQSADVVLSADQIAFKLETASEDLEEWFEDASATSTEDRWFAFDRNVFTERELHPDAIAAGKDEDLREALRDVELTSWAAPSDSEIVERNGRRLVKVKLNVDEGRVERGLVSLVSAWFVRDPDAEEIDWANRAAQGVADGDWYAEIDAKTKQFTLIQGDWPLMDEGKEYGRATAVVRLSGIGGQVSITAPEDTVDLTKAIDTAGPGSFAPAGDR